jgi:hypothetical protein
MWAPPTRLIQAYLGLRGEIIMRSYLGNIRVMLAKAKPARRGFAMI